MAEEGIGLKTVVYRLGSNCQTVSRTIHFVLLLRRQDYQSAGLDAFLSMIVYVSLTPSM
jgi:hypothetical protein